MQDVPRRLRRRRSAQFKLEVLAACAQPGASVASVALSHGVNAGLVHRWRHEAANRGRARRANAELAEFVPLTIVAAPVVAASDKFRIELRRGACAVSIARPASAETAHAGSLYELLR